MELLDPVQSSDRSTVVPILQGYDLEIPYDPSEYTATTSPSDKNPVLAAYVMKLASMYEQYALDHYSENIPFLTFLKKVSHRWTFREYPPPTLQGILKRVRQLWRPEQIVVHPLTFQIYWTLCGVEYDVTPQVNLSGASQDMKLEYVEPNDLPFEDGNEIVQMNTSLRSRARRKVRLARLHASMAKWRASQLTARYYERYGTLEGGKDGAESILSTDSEMETEMESLDKNIGSH
jgi:hypothetical protein